MILSRSVDEDGEHRTLKFILNGSYRMRCSRWLIRLVHLMVSGGGFGTFRTLMILGGMHVPLDKFVR